MTLKRILKYLFLLFLIFQIKGNLAAQSFYVSISSNDDTEICQGDSVAINLVFYFGSAPFTVVINDKDGEFIKLEGIRSPYTFYVYPESDNSYYVSSAVDRRGREGKGIGSVTVTVHQTIPVSIILERTAYLVNEPGVLLESDPPGAIFSGDGVIGNTFYPGIATPVGSPHLISCSYLNQNGCVSKDSREVYVLYGNPEVYLISDNDTIDDICNGSPSCRISAENGDNLPGTFALFVSGSSVPVQGHILDDDLTDNEAELLLVGLSGAYTVVYTYGIETLEISASRDFTVHDIGFIGIRDLPDTVCKNDDPYPLIPELISADPQQVYTFSGPGVTGNQSDGFFFDPSMQEVPSGPVEIYLEYTSSNGCSFKMTFTVVVGQVPDLKFTLDDICLEPEGGMVQFINQTSRKDLVESWQWDFGDPSSGNNNYSNLENPEHFYSEPGPKTILLSAMTHEGCLAETLLDTLLADRPLVDFTWSSDCYTEGQAIVLESNVVSIYSALDTLVWAIRSDEGGLINLIGKEPSVPDLEFIFPRTGQYDIMLFAENEAGCTGEITRQLELLPVYTIPDEGYLEDFNLSSPDWTVSSEESVWSWVQGEPDFIGFVPVQNDLAWYTDLPAHSEGYLEKSWISSPCFDLSGLNNPVIQLDLMKSFRPGLDGAVLQYQGVPTEGWITVGDFGEGFNWYNHAAIVNMPGGSSAGWSLVNNDPDAQWVTASHPVGLQSPNIPVRFRLALATGGTLEIAPGVFNQGFAFDNFFIGDAILRRSVLEYFTNTAGELTEASDSIVKRYSVEHPGMVYDLHYHMDYPEEDPMNAYNPVPPSTRAFNYGVPDIPYAVLNGGVTPEYRFDLAPPSGSLDDDVLYLSASETPVFELSLSVNYSENRLEGQVIVTCASDNFESNLQLYLVVLEKEVTLYPYLTSDTSFRNVVLDMLPSEGIYLGNNWSPGSMATRDFTWDYVTYIEDIEDLSVVAFVQDRDNGWVLQADEVSYSTAVGTTSRMDLPGRLSIYPNPARDELTVYFGIPTGAGDQLVLVDLSGREIMNIRIPQASDHMQLDISSLQPGVYTLLWKEEDLIRGYAKFIRYQ